MEHPDGGTGRWCVPRPGSPACGPLTRRIPLRHPFYDATTIFPDHVVGRITAIGALAALIRRRRTGAGARIHVSQAEAGINQVDTGFVMLAAEAARAHVDEDPTVHLVLSCAGDDEWCVVSIGSESRRAAVAGVTGGAELAEWAARHTPQQVADQLQAAGVAAGPMYRPEEVYEHPQLRLRKVLADMAHPLFEVPLPAEMVRRRSATSRTRPSRRRFPARTPGWVCRRRPGYDAR